jgi:hypothetical protein
MANVRVVLITCEKYSWCLPPFAYLFNVYWSTMQPVLIGGMRDPGFGLPANFSFVCESGCNYGPNKWSNSLIQTLELIHDDVVVIMLEDYLICRTVDCGGVNTLAEYMYDNPDVLRMDLTTDRLYGGGMHDVMPYGHYDLIACPKDAPYEMSLQAGLWNRRNLLSLLKPDMSSWEVEIHTNMAITPFRVLGTRQYPLRYANLVFKGKIADGELDRIPEPHRSEVEKWIPKGWEHVEKYG